MTHDDKLWQAVKFDKDGLIPVIAQDSSTKQVLMLAWMNKGAIQETLSTRQMCYWSRSRGRLWRKGESSGQTQKLVELRLDCDGDALLALIEQQGVACHTGRQRCFYNLMDSGGLMVTDPVITPPDELYKDI